MVYVLHDKESGYVKIGSAKDPQRRLATLQTGNPHELIILRTIETNDDINIEHRMHWMFDDYRVRNNNLKHSEWFEDRIIPILTNITTADILCYPQMTKRDVDARYHRIFQQTKLPKFKEDAPFDINRHYRSIELSDDLISMVHPKPRFSQALQRLYEFQSFGVTPRQLGFIFDNYVPDRALKKAKNYKQEGQ